MNENLDFRRGRRPSPTSGILVVLGFKCGAERGFLRVKRNVVSHGNKGRSVLVRGYIQDSR